MGRGRAPCCDKSKVKKGPWSPAEDLKLIAFIQKHGHGNWRSLPKQAGLLRCGKSCRLRWINYLRPDVKRGNFTTEEEETIIKLHQSLGNKWSKIASCLPGRTDNEIKNIWNTHLKKRLANKKDAKFQKHETKESSGTYSSSPTSSTGSIIQTNGPHEERNTEDVLGNKKQDIHSSSTDQPKEVMLEVNNQTSVNLDIMLDIPLESDINFWNMLDNLDPFPYSNRSETEELEANSQSTNLGEECDHREIECMKWLRYLENELELEATSDAAHYQEAEMIKLLESNLPSQFE